MNDKSISAWSAAKSRDENTNIHHSIVENKYEHFWKKDQHVSRKFFCCFINEYDKRHELHATVASLRQTETSTHSIIFSFIFKKTNKAY